MYIYLSLYMYTYICIYVCFGSLCLASQECLLAIPEISGKLFGPPHVQKTAHRKSNYYTIL